MRHPVFVRPLTESERSRLEAGLRAQDLSVLRRGQVVLASARGAWAPRIAALLGGSDQTVRNVLRRFEREGLEAGLTRRSSRPPTRHATLDARGREHRRARRDQSPRTCGTPTSGWTVDRAAAVSVAAGSPAERVSGAALRQALPRLGIRWQRAPPWRTRPAPADARKHVRATA